MASAFTKTLGSDLGAFAHVCQITPSQATTLGLLVRVSDGSSGFEAVYRERVPHNSTGTDVWRRLAPTRSLTKPATWALELSSAATGIRLRLVRTASASGSSAASLKGIVNVLGAPGMSTAIADDPATGTLAAVAVDAASAQVYRGAVVSRVDGMVGIQAPRPTATLTVAGSASITGNVRLTSVSDVPVATASAGGGGGGTIVPNYRYYRFMHTQTRTIGDMVQISELDLRYNGVRVNYSSAVASNPGGLSYVGEESSKAIDNNVNTKWLDVNVQPLIIDFGQNTLVDSYTFSTANDFESRDPVSWTFSGSNDNSTWVELHSATNYATPTARNTYLPYFSLATGNTAPATSWVSRQSPADYEWNFVAYANGQFLAVAGDYKSDGVMTSTDGISWTLRSTPITQHWGGAAYGNGRWVIVAWYGGYERIAYSTDNGVSWTHAPNLPLRWWGPVCFGNGTFVARGAWEYGAYMYTSTDGAAWTERSVPNSNGVSDMAFGNGLFVGVCSSGTGNRVMTSPDGVSWTARSTPADNSWEGVCFANNMFVAVASTGTGNRVMTSTDGVSWTLRTSPADLAWRAVAFGDGRFVAVASTGTGSRAMTSTDGVTWTLMSTPADNEWYGVAYGNGRFVSTATTGTGNRLMTMDYASGGGTSGSGSGSATTDPGPILPMYIHPSTHQLSRGPGLEGNVQAVQIVPNITFGGNVHLTNLASATAAEHLYVNPSTGLISRSPWNGLNFTSFIGNASSGYHVFDNGFKLMWGSFQASSFNVYFTIWYPIAFSSWSVPVVSGAEAGHGGSRGLGPTSVGTSSFTVWNASDRNTFVTWIAVGV